MDDDEDGDNLGLGTNNVKKMKDYFESLNNKNELTQN